MYRDTVPAKGVDTLPHLSVAVNDFYPHFHGGTSGPACGGLKDIVVGKLMVPAGWIVDGHDPTGYSTRLVPGTCSVHAKIGGRIAVQIHGKWIRVHAVEVIELIRVFRRGDSTEGLRDAESERQDNN